MGKVKTEYQYCLKTQKEITETEKKKILKMVPNWGRIQRAIKDTYSPDSHTYVLATTKRKKIVGVGAISEDKYDKSFELNIFVLESQRKSGIGRGMVEHIFKRTKLKELRVHHTPDGKPFFKKLGGKSDQILTKLQIFWDSFQFMNPLTFRKISIKTALRLPATHPARPMAEYLANQHNKLHKKREAK